MGFYVNPPADAFKAILRSKTYIDKSGLIAYMNQVLETSRMLTCFSRPRRFGKSFAAKMLAAYYSRGADSRELFEDLEIAGMKDAQFEENLNRHDVLFFDMTSFISMADSINDTIRDLQSDIIHELKEIFPNCINHYSKRSCRSMQKQAGNSSSSLMSGMLCSGRHKRTKNYRKNTSNYCGACLKAVRLPR